MPLQNRVAPDGSVHAEASRGLFMGNRGQIHDWRTKTLLNRNWTTHGWICCRLDYKGVRRQLMGEGQYTELFFLDEVTALAAGHRPCGYCRRDSYNAFRHAWRTAVGQAEAPSAAEMDRRLHADRVASRRKQRFEAPAASLPDGTMIEIDGKPWAVRGAELLAWSFSGYRDRLPRPQAARVTVLTPAIVVDVLGAGYRPVWY